MKYVQITFGQLSLTPFVPDKELSPLGYCFTFGKLHFPCSLDFKAFGVKKADEITLENQALMATVFQAWRHSEVIDRLPEAEFREMFAHMQDKPVHVSLLFVSDGETAVISDAFRELAVAF